MNNEIFQNKNLSDVFKDIYKNTDEKRSQINAFILKLTKLVMTADDAVLIAPIIKDFMEVNVKNDEHIVKVAQIAQRALAVGEKAAQGMDTLSEMEKQQILSNISDEIASLQRDIQEVEDEFDLLEDHSKSVNK